MRILSVLLPVACCGLLSCGPNQPGTAIHPSDEPPITQTRTVILRRGDGLRDHDFNFLVRNDGGTPLAVELMAKTCGCVGLFREPSGEELPLHGKFVIPPRSTANLRLRNKSGGSPGTVSQVVTLRLVGDGVDRAMSLRSTLVVVPEVATEPAALEFESLGEAKAGQRKSLIVVCNRGISGRRLKEKLVQPALALPPGVLLAEGPTLVAETIGDDCHMERWRLTLANDQSACLTQPLYQRMEVSFRDPTTSALSVPITINPPSGPQAVPNLVQIPEVVVGGVGQGRVFLMARGGTKFTVSKVTSSDASFSVSPVGGGLKEKHWLDISFKPSRPGKFAADIQIHLDGPGGKPLEVKAIGSCVRQG